jgi:hypothetical protein
MVHRKELLIASIIYFCGALYGYYKNVLPYTQLVSNHAKQKPSLLVEVPSNRTRSVFNKNDSVFPLMTSYLFSGVYFI